MDPRFPDDPSDSLPDDEDDDDPEYSDEDPRRPRWRSSDLLPLFFLPSRRSPRFLDPDLCDRCDDLRDLCDDALRDDRCADLCADLWDAFLDDSFLRL